MMEIKNLVRVNLLCLTGALSAGSVQAEVNFLFEQDSSDSAVVILSSDKTPNQKETILANRSADGKCVRFEKEGKELFQACSSDNSYTVTGADVDASWTEIQHIDGNIIEWKSGNEVRRITKKVSGHKVKYHEGNEVIASANPKRNGTRLNVPAPARDGDIVRTALPDAFWLSQWAPALLASTPVVDAHQGDAGLLPVEKTLDGSFRSNAALAGISAGVGVGLAAIVAGAWKAVKAYRAPTPSWKREAPIPASFDVCDMQTFQGLAGSFLKDVLQNGRVLDDGKFSQQGDEDSVRVNTTLKLTDDISNEVRVFGKAFVNLVANKEEIKITISFGRVLKHASTLTIRDGGVLDRLTLDRSLKEVISKLPRTPVAVAQSVNAS